MRVLFLALTSRFASDIFSDMKSLTYAYTMKFIRLFVAVIIIFSFACSKQDQSDRQTNQLLKAENTPWENGQEVEISGVIYPSRADARFYLQTEDGAGAHIKRGTDIDILEEGTRLWIKGTIEYTLYEKPEDYDEKQYGVRLPQTICYIAVEEFAILE